MNPAFLEPRYQPSEVARLLDVSPDTVRRWLGSPAKGQGALVQKETPTNWASFLDMVELHLACQLKKKARISMRRLRQLIHEAARRENLDHPLARRRYLVDGEKLWLPLTDEMVELGTDGQLGLMGIVEQVAESLDFDVEGVAERWWPAGRDGGVVIDPLVAFGAPVLKGSRINTAVIYDAWQAEDRDAEIVARWYGRSVVDIKKAVEFEQRRAAA